MQGFDRIIIQVPDVDRALRQYEVLLGVAPLALGGGRAWVGMPNTVLELVQHSTAAVQIKGLVFRDAAHGAAQQVENSLGLYLEVCDGTAVADFRREHPRAQCESMAVDHIVLRTSDAQSCIELFAERLGIRLALDKTVPEWGGRMLFFRTGKLTLEVIESAVDEVAQNAFWGLALQCRDIEQEARRLQSVGVALSEVRAGRKPGTRVATVNSHHLDIPTLLIEPAT